MAMLRLQIRGEWFKVNNKGEMTQENRDDFSGQWKFLGVSFHHWTNHIEVPFDPDQTPDVYVEGLLWDEDHGTIRQWRGQYNGRLPRITSAYKA